MSSSPLLQGMVMLWISAFRPIPGDEGGVYFAAAVLLMAVGRGGGLPILEGFLVCQLRDHEPRQLDIADARKIVWWITAKLIPKLSTPWIFRHGSWRAKFMVSTSVMAIGYFLFWTFWCCIPLYHHRLHAIAEGGFCVDQDYYVPSRVIPLSIMRLAPQFCLLGLLEGIGREGLDLFFEVQVSDEPMKAYGSALNGAVIGLGSFLNAILVFCFKSWFGDTLNCSSRLDNYYQMLMILSFVNLCYYSCFVSIYYSNKNKTKDVLQVEAAGAGVVSGSSC
ncbi:hypothetical protein RHMOL_Rhmol07G0303900 [Rhododendron molle]|uniref:Uncharacterized protein n=1 Tax=Rhododendron molle TaxID=49168 RepID=A0ACC0N896_RHOML|nr:hypothetical protein RHMOL_Rhmol07G0303900 [Rhododendron molle]